MKRARELAERQEFDAPPRSPRGGARARDDGGRRDVGLGGRRQSSLTTLVDVERWAASSGKSSPNRAWGGVGGRGGCCAGRRRPIDHFAPRNTRGRSSGRLDAHASSLTSSSGGRDDDDVTTPRSFHPPPSRADLLERIGRVVARGAGHAAAVRRVRRRRGALRELPQRGSTRRPRRASAAPPRRRRRRRARRPARRAREPARGIAEQRARVARRQVAREPVDRASEERPGSDGVFCREM